MKIVFGFSDESDEHKPERTDKFINKVPYYVRGTLLIDAENWKEQ